MAVNPIGVTFSPDQNQAQMGKKNWDTMGGTPEAIQILSLHVPKFAGARALAPDALLQQNSNNPVNAVVESVLRGLGHSPMPQSPQGASPEGGDLLSLIRGAMGHGQQRFEPTPNVTPGAEPITPPQTPLPTQKTGPSEVLGHVNTGQLPTSSGWDYRGRFK